MAEPTPDSGEGPSRPDRRARDGRRLIWRHPLPVRLTHWINAAVIVVLMMTGANILAAHPHLYWGLKSTFADPWLSFPLIPDWLMMPRGRDLATARGLHFLFAWVFVFNGLIYLAYIVLSGRLRRVLEPSRSELAGLGHSVVEHARLRFPRGEAARRYNVLQKLTYLAVLFGALPLMLATGLAMSPGFNAILPELLDLLGGRQSARTLHFLSASAIAGFIVVHVGLVILTGFGDQMRGMLTGWLPIDDDPEETPHDPA